MKDPDDQILVQQARAGQSAAFGDLARRYYPSLVAIADAVLLDRHLAEDAAQEALAAASRQLAGLQNPERFGSWIAVICRNIARDMLRDVQQRKHLTGYALATGRDKGDGDNEEGRTMLMQALQQLPPRLREVIFLKFYDNMSYRQMAAIVGAREKTIDGRIRRAKKKLALYLKRAGFER